MTSNTLMKAGVGAILAFGLVAAPLALAPAQADPGSAPAAQTTTTALAPSGSLSAAVTQAITANPHVAINEAYLNGGSTGATYKNKFVELYNPTNADVSLDGWSLQYRPGTGTAAPGNVAALTGTIKAKGYFLVNGGSNGANGRDLPAADFTGTTINPAAGAGTIILSDQAAKLPADLPVGSLVGQAGVVDLLGYGTSNTFENAPASAASVSTSLNRTDGADTDNNVADFVRDSPTPIGTQGGDTPPPPPVDAGSMSIAEVQGTGAASPFEGSVVTTKGKVTAVYADGGFNGYFIQTPGTGGDIDLATHQASDGVFVYSPSTVRNIKVGDYVQVKGQVTEFGAATDKNKTTEINVSASDMTVLTDPAVEVKATALKTVPATDAERESLEGMLVSPQGTFTITDNYSLSSYGEVGLAAGTTALVQPTAVAPYGSPAYTTQLAENAARSISIDDGSSVNFSTTGSATPLPWLTANTPMRIGSQGEFSSNVIFDNRNNAYKFQPLAPLTAANAASVQPIGFGNTRAATPNDVGGNLKIASFNVQNYFPTTGDQDPSCQFYTDRENNPITVKGGCQQRGAADAANLKRQQDKIVSGITASGADVLSLEEIENSAKFGKDRDNALSILVAALNEKAPGVWDYVRSPAKRPAIADEDVIHTAFIYKKAIAAPVGESVILDDKAFTGIARQPLAQSFKLADAPDASKVLLIVNHFKSKGSAIGNDTDKGQGNSNLARTAQAKALLAFSTQLQEDQGTDKVMLMGDFNAYLHEDPINVLTDAGYVDQDSKTTKHSYAYSGMVGSLDHILASPAAESMVSGVDIWNINSAESVAMGYSRYNANVTNFYDTSAFSASDHDPVVVGLNLPAAAGSSTEVNLLGINDFHGRIDNNTVNFAGTVEQLRAESGAANTAFISAGDNVGASLFASASQKDQPTIDVLNALGLQASAVGNHEFDGGFADLTDRIINPAAPNAKFDYLGANVYKKGTTTPALDEYKVLTVGGVKVAVIGVVTQEAPTLVSPAGISMLEFGDPVDAVNRVAKKITDGHEADVIVAEYHEGASAGTPDGATLDQEIAAGSAFSKIVTKTSPSVNAIFTGHTHKEYSWDAPIPGVAADAPVKTRPIVQTGDYGENVGQVKLVVDNTTKAIKSYTDRNVARTTTPAADLIAKYPAVSAVNDIVKKALADSVVAGSKQVGKISADITTAQTVDPVTGAFNRDDRGSESALGNLVGNALLDSLKDPATGGAEIGVVNPGGLRADLLYKAAGRADGVVTYADANAVLPFLNNLWTTSLTGSQVKTMLEQQWQTNADGSIPSRPFLNLGLSSNVDYTYDSTKSQGNHITSVTINGAPLDEKRLYRVGTFSFVATGGDNFRVFTQGTNTKDSGLVDRDAWIKYLGEKSATAPLAPDFARRGVDVVGAPASVVEGQKVTVGLNKLDLTSLGVTKSTKVSVKYEPQGAGAVLPADLGSYPVTNGAATLSFTVPARLNAGRLTITTDGGTSARLPITIPVTAVVVPPKTLTAATPTVSGMLVTGQKLTANPGIWGPAPVSLAYQWNRNGVAINKATISTYVLTSADLGKKMTVTMTGSKAGYTTASKTSTTTAAVTAPKALKAAVPGISGSTVVGQKLAANVGIWGPAPVTLAYQWNRNGVAINKATAGTYVLTSADLGKKMTVTVTGTKAGYTTASRTSGATAAVTAPKTLKTAVPGISGSTVVGKKLTAKAGTWGPAPVALKYQWNRNGVAISKATAGTYVLTKTDLGKKITVTVTGSKAGYTTASKTSGATKAVTAK